MFVLMCLSKGEGVVCTDVPIKKGEEGVVCTDVPIKGEEGVFILRKLCVLMCLSKGRRRLCVLMCLSKGRRGCVY